MLIMCSPKKYPFPEVFADDEYRLFPDALENDDHVFFHGTAAGNLQSILDNGFLSAVELASEASVDEPRATGLAPDVPLTSVAFFHNSSSALAHACIAKKKESSDGCVLAVRYECIDKPHIKPDSTGILDYKREPQPKIIGFCIVPANYVYM